MTLTMSFSDYPAQFVPYTDSTVTWQITIVDPCTTTVIDNFDTLGSMSVYVLGASQYQPFTDVKDSISVAWDSYYAGNTQSYTVNAPIAPSASFSSAAYSGPVVGTTTCGTRTYQTNCAYLTVNSYLGKYPYL